MGKKIILFGCGKLGYEALVFFGAENIESFCDNNPRLTGGEIYGKSVISFDTLKERCRDDIVMICADFRHSNEIAEQCEKSGITDYIYYCYFQGKFQERKEAVSYLGNMENRMLLRKEIYRVRLDELTRQVAYLEKHIDIRDLKPAKGRLRERQLAIVNVAADFLEKIEELEIRPFLYGGNLLGYVRHDGFIPWDDDIDFALLRKEYEKLKVFLREHIYTREEFEDKKKRDASGKQVPKGMEEYYWVNLGDLTKVVRPSAEVKDVDLDFFPCDFYVDGYSYEEMRVYAGKVKEALAKTATLEEKIKCLEDALTENRQNLAEESNHIYFGIDSMEMMHLFHKGDWIPRDVVLPLKKVLFEGEYFWVPNAPEEFLSYEFENIWEFPEDVGIPRHVAISESE